MELITGNIRKLYLKYLGASMASALVMSIYSFVDTIAVGQAEGPTGAASMAVINPLFGIIVFISVLCGVGGAVLYGNARGEGKEEKANALFSAACGLMTVLTLLLWGAFALFRYPILAFFGADETIIPTVMEYAELIIAFMPFFVASIFISAFVRNDGAPNLAMAAVIIGGCINMFGDWFFVFPLGMGMRGAAIATVLGTGMQVVILCIHFFTKKCTLRLVRPFHVRPYSLLYLFLGVTVLATYHLQSIMHGKMSLIIALLRSAVISGILLYILPLFLDLLGVWLAMPVAELIVAAIAVIYIRKQ